jgi:hypothetical protein
MAMSLASLKKSAPRSNPFGLIYGVEKVGKTSLACEAPKPILLRTPGENPPAGVEVDTFEDEAKTLNDFFDAVGSLITEDHDFQTFIIDSGDGLNRLVEDEACKRNGWPSIEEPGYGKGYVEALNIWNNEVLAALSDLRTIKGMSVLLITHAEITKFDSPTSDSYNRYRPNLRKNVADLIQAQADFIAFVNHRVSIVKEKGGFNQETKRGEGAGLRVMYFDERPGFIAGSRYNHPSEITYKPGKGWEEIAKHLPGSAS